MDIPTVVLALPLEERVEVQNAIKTLMASKVFESILNQCEQEVLSAAMVLAHNRESIKEIERVAIKTATAHEFLMGFTEALKAKEN